MSDIRQAAHDLQVLAARFKPVLAVAEALERIGDLETAEAVALQKRDHALEEASKAQVVLLGMERKLQAAQAEVDQVRLQAKTLASDAETSAVRLKEQATNEAAAVVEAANRQKQSVQVAIDELKQTKRDLETELDARKKELAAITAKIADTKASIARLAG